MGPALAPGQCAVCGSRCNLARVTVGELTSLVCLTCLATEGPAEIALPARFLSLLTVPVPRSEPRVPCLAEPDSACSQCGATFGEVMAGGLLGCPGCYEAFAAAVESGLARLHGAP